MNLIQINSILKTLRTELMDRSLPRSQAVHWVVSTGNKCKDFYSGFEIKIDFEISTRRRRFGSCSLNLYQVNYLLKQKHQHFPLTLNKTQSLRTYIFNVQNLFENSMALGDP